MHDLLLQPLAGTSIANWLHLLQENGGIDRTCLSKAAIISLFTLATTAPRSLERLWCGHQIDQVDITQPPIFIIGHWRSGTTYLHNLISQDPQFGYVSNQQAFNPSCVLINHRLITWYLKTFLPNTRPMDGMSFAPDLPQEEEFALANLCAHSFYHGWFFPKRMRAYFEECILFQTASPDRIKQWKQAYTQILKVATLRNQGKQLLLKNPSNTGRIRQLLELFPDAKFIHIYRNPYAVYFSTQKLYHTLVKITALQTIEERELEENILQFYEQLMRQYLQDKALIPAGNLIEVQYEQFDRDPLPTLETIYQTFNLSNFETLRSHFETYIATHRHHRKDQYPFNGAIADKIAQRWGFALDAWHYNLPTNPSFTPSAASQ